MRSLGWGGAIVFVAAGVLPPPHAAGEDFGPGPVTTFIAARSFVPRLSTIGYVDDIDGYRSGTSAPPGGGATFIASLDLPDGAQVDRIDLDACDPDAASFLDLTVWRCELDAATQQHLCYPLPGAFVGTGGTPGCGLFAINNPIAAVDNAAHTYRLVVVDDAISPTTRFHGAKVTWRRKVAPGPATPTFSDVPAGHFAYRFVEALAAAQITAGCTATQYCPDAPITRAQMAVFLAAALGLGWQ